MLFCLFVCVVCFVCFVLLFVLFCFVLFGAVDDTNGDGEMFVLVDFGGCLLLCFLKLHLSNCSLR